VEALGDPTRRRIFELLGGGERAVGDLASRLPVSRPAVSQHLRVLEEAGLVRARQEGTRRYYAVDARGVRALRDYFDRFWEAALDDFKAAAERSRK
jgi:DNA-binding transcriptional ArsR family regulator